MKRRRRSVRRGDLRVAAATCASFALVILLNQPSTNRTPAIPTWGDTSVLRLNLPQPRATRLPSPRRDFVPGYRVARVDTGGPVTPDAKDGSSWQWRSDEIRLMSFHGESLAPVLMPPPLALPRQLPTGR